LLKNAPRSELLSAIRQVHNGKQYLPADIARSLAERDASEPLTVREIEALQLASKGCSNKEIASVLAITEHTAKAHMKHILEKLGVEDRTGAVTLALRRGIIHLEE
jgi:DNA-binding NarL/FixJ family response regulator